MADPGLLDKGGSAVNLKGIWPRRASTARAVHAAGVGVGAFFGGGGGDLAEAAASAASMQFTAVGGGGATRSDGTAVGVQNSLPKIGGGLLCPLDPPLL